MAHSDHQKHLIFMRGWLLGRNYNVALRALEYAAEHHTGKRKDGITPEFSHQIDIAHFVRTLTPAMRQPEEVLATVFLHDVCEDYDIGFDVIADMFGDDVARGVRRMTKVHRGVSVPTEAYYSALAKCPIASIAKPADRDHNLRSMPGVFTIEKQIAYITETRDYVLPAIKEARKLFPDQEPIYSNLKHSLENQVHVISKFIEAMKA